MPLLDLSSRRREPEWMDEPALDRDLHVHALAALHRVNRLSGTAARLWRPIRRLASELPKSRLRVLDLASGGGDVAIALAITARRADVLLQIDGCDVSATAVAHAESRAYHHGLDNVGFFVLDVLQADLPPTYDVVICSLFLHHLDEADAVRLLRQMAAATRRLVLVDDLRRTRFGYALAWLGCQLLTRSPIVHTDGPRSVRAAFTLAEARQLAHRAGLDGCRIVAHWPQRFLLSWSKS
ncbi:MAG TPA: methyltransferase domain-containing protein [Pirellulales bacterium]|jgi:SAM-dependent methyltransferase|nr:methyltransferase domain-containing protein [Pirellulales bacterium]